MIEIRWHGRGGQGGFTAAKLLGASISLYGDRYALSFPSFGPERRGAPVLAYTKIDNQKILDRSEITKCDYIVILDESLFNESFLYHLKPDGRIIINSNDVSKYKNNPSVFAIDATSLSLEILEKPITNTAMLGALIGVSGILELDAVLSGTEDFMKGELLVKNKRLIERAFGLAREGLHEQTTTYSA